MTDPIVIFVRFLAKAGSEEALRAGLTRFVDPTRAEPANLHCDLLQCVDQPAVFFFHEAWTSREELDAYIATPAFQALDRSLLDLQAEPYSVVSTRTISAPAA